MMETEDGRQVCAGIRAWYEPADLVGKQVVIVANLETAKDPRRNSVRA